MKSKIGILLAAAAAFGVYKYYKMTPEEKENLKNKGKDFVNRNFGDVHDLFGKKSHVNENA